MTMWPSHLLDVLIIFFCCVLSGVAPSEPAHSGADRACLLQQGLLLGEEKSNVESLMVSRTFSTDPSQAPDVQRPNQLVEKDSGHQRAEQPVVFPQKDNKHLVVVAMLIVFMMAATMSTSFLPVAEENRNLAFNVLVVTTWLLVGCAFFMFYEDWYFSTALYVMVQIITTIGYGDVTPKTWEGQVFMAVFVLIGIFIIAGIVTATVNFLIQAQADALCGKMTTVSSSARVAAGKEREEDAAERLLQQADVPRQELIQSILRFCFFLLTWTVFFSSYESCSCSYGVTKVEGCKVGAECAATGGVTKTFGEALYMGVITMSTVGFGDYAPVTDFGRLCGSFWMLLGVVSTGKLVTDISIWMSAQNKAKATNMDRKMFDLIDVDRSGDLNETEFLAWVLLREGVIGPKELSEMKGAFQAIDKDKSGSLSYSEIVEHFDKVGQRLRGSIEADETS